MATDLGVAEAVTPLIGGSSGGQGPRTIAFQISGTFVGTITFEATVDGVNFVAAGAQPISGSGTAASTATAPGIWVIVATGLAAVRGRMSAYTSGTATVAVNTAEA